MSLRNKLVTAKTKKDNIEYKTSEENTKKLREEKKTLQKLLPSMKKDEPKKKETNILIEALEVKLQKEKDELKKINFFLKSSKNEGVNNWELETPKEIRAGAVNDVYKAYKTGFANLKLGNIKHFHLGFRKKRESKKCLLLPRSFVKNKEGRLSIAPRFLKEESNISMGKKTIKKHKDLVIEHDCRLVKQKNEYWLIVPIPFNLKKKTKPVNYCGIDPGVKTFMTTFGNQGCFEYKHNETILKKLDDKIKLMKDKRILTRYRVLKSKINKVEKRKENLINELHWKTIRSLLEKNDFIFYGDIKSHDIVKDGKNRTLNTSMNNLKFYKFKERLLFKSVELGKKVFETKEQFTTQTCSFCGNMYKPGLSRVYNCSKCNKKIGRDVNASKNILMKGIVKYLL
jgi:transposase